MDSDNNKIILDAAGLRPGLVIEEAVMIKAEAKISVSEYLCVALRDGNGERVRVMFPAGSVVVPSPQHTKMLELYQAGSRFFSLDEIFARQNNEAIVERPGGTLAERPESAEEKWERLGNSSRLGDNGKGKSRPEIDIE